MSPNHEILGIAKDVKIEQGDITDFNTVQKLIDKYQPNEIYNFAAQSSVGKSFANPIETLDSIIQGTINILEVSKKLNYTGHLFFAGSSEIFGHTIKKADLGHSQKPANPYAIGKQASLNLVKIYREIHNLKCVTGILFNHESPLRNETFVTQKIISGAIHCLKNRNHKLELGNLNIARDWGWAPEYVEGVQIMTRSKLLKDQVICTGELTTLKKFIEITFTKLNLNWEDHVQSKKTLYRASDIEKSYGDPIPMHKDLNWKANVKIEELIEMLISSKLKKL